MSLIKKYKKFTNFEALLWIVGIIYLATIDPYQHGHIDFCLFKIMGFEFCPGCGLGKSISMIFQGDIINSIKTHPIGIFALIFIIRRIIELLFKSNSNNHIKFEVYHA
jgi:hypothetical protein